MKRYRMKVIRVIQVLVIRWGGVSGPRCHVPSGGVAFSPVLWGGGGGVGGGGGRWDVAISGGNSST